MTKDKMPRNIAFIAGIVFVLALPLIVQNEYWIHVFVIIAITILMTACLRTLFQIGEMSLGTAGFMLIGAYTSALLNKYTGISFWVCLPAGGLASAAIAALVGYPFFRVKGAYFVILTLLLAQVFQQLTGYAKEQTGGWDGVRHIPPPDPIAIPGLPPITFDTDLNYYYFAIVIIAVCLFILYRMQHSRVGLVWGSIRESDFFAQSLGVNIMAQKIFIFVVISFFVGIAGGLYAFYVRALSPATNPGNIFSITASVYLILYMVIGGEGSFLGPILGTALLVLVPEFARGMSVYRPLVSGALMIIIVFFFPKGLVGLAEYVPIWYTSIRNRLKKKVPA
jgi:branched-chain amino acid transport system permease protein